MHETYERRGEKKFCYFIKDYVDATLIFRRWLIADGTWQEEEKGIECPLAKKCRRTRLPCSAIDPKEGTDPFIPLRDLIADMW